MQNKVIDMLLVEDSPEDVDLMRMAFKESEFPMALNVASNGEEAMRYLKDDSIPLPDMVILDLNLPRKNGREVLVEMKTDAKLRKIPVVILTTSRSREDILSCYDKHSNCYICKPLDFERYIDVIGEIKNFWLRTVRLPADDGWKQERE